MQGISWSKNGDAAGVGGKPTPLLHVGPLLVNPCADFRDWRACGNGTYERRQWQRLRVEIIDGQVAVRLNDDWFRAGFNRLRIDAVGQSLLNDDGVAKVAFGLTQEIADVDGFAESYSCRATRRVAGNCCLHRQRTS